eukprot:4978213-Amphidinium_carterae.1
MVESSWLKLYVPTQRLHAATWIIPAWCCIYRVPRKGANFSGASRQLNEGSELWVQVLEGPLAAVQYKNRIHHDLCLGETACRDGEVEEHGHATNGRGTHEDLRSSEHVAGCVVSALSHDLHGKGISLWMGWTSSHRGVAHLAP